MSVVERFPIQQACMMILRLVILTAMFLALTYFPILNLQNLWRQSWPRKQYQFRAVGTALVWRILNYTLGCHTTLICKAVAFEAEPFQSTSNPLRFRSIPDSLAKFHVEASECCLVHYDNPISLTAGVWINPTVRVGYSSQAYAAVTGREWPTTSELRWGKWKSKRTWWIRDPIPSLKASFRIWLWRRKYPNISEPGFACVQDLAMVITTDGWRLRGAKFE